MFCSSIKCECVVLASDTAPVREVIRDGENGLLNDFYDVDGFAQKALRVLRDPDAYRPLGRAGAKMVRDQYSLDYCLPRLASYYERVRAAQPTDRRHEQH